MNLKVGNSYKIILKVDQAILTYSCKLTSEDEHFISFIDKFNQSYTYNKNIIISIQEITQ